MAMSSIIGEKTKSRSPSDAPAPVAGVCRGAAALTGATNQQRPERCTTSKGAAADRPQRQQTVSGGEDASSSVSVLPDTPGRGSSSGENSGGASGQKRRRKDGADCGGGSAPAAASALDNGTPEAPARVTWTGSVRFLREDGTPGEELCGVAMQV